MSERRPLNGSEPDPIESMLLSLKPNAAALDREHACYLAGYAAAEARLDAAAPLPFGRRAAWPAAFGGMTTMAALFLMMLVGGGSDRITPHGTDSTTAQSPISRQVDPHRLSVASVHRDVRRVAEPAPVRPSQASSPADSSRRVAPLSAPLTPVSWRELREI